MRQMVSQRVFATIECLNPETMAEIWYMVVTFELKVDMFINLLTRNASNQLKMFYLLLLMLQHPVTMG